MRHLSFAAATLCLLLAVPRPTRAGQIIYDIQNYPADQSGHTISGIITTDGVIGPLASADITSWTVTIDNTFTFQSTGPGAVTILGDVQATPTDLTLSGSATAENLLELANTPSSNGTLTWARVTPTAGFYTATTATALIWDTTNPSMGGTDPWVLAAVPEPSTLWLLGTATTAGLAYGWSRHRRDQRRQRPVGPPDATE